MQAETTARKQRGQQLAPYRFQKGQSGNPKGRPKGSRHKLGELFVADLQALWEQHGREVLVACLKDKPGDVLRAVSQIVPKEVSIEAGPSFRALFEAVAKGTIPTPPIDEEE